VTTERNGPSQTRDRHKFSRGIIQAQCLGVADQRADLSITNEERMSKDAWRHSMPAVEIKPVAEKYE